MRIRSLSAGILLLMLWAVLAYAAAPMTKLVITIKTQGGHPVDRAEVIVRWNASEKHPAARYGRAVRTTYEMRTNQEGQVNVPTIPQGTILIQVNAKGYQTFGKVFTVEEEEQNIDIALNPPQQQYSAH